MKIVIDTSLLIDFTRRKKNKRNEMLWSSLVRYSRKGGHQLIVPSVVVFEFFSGKEMENSTNLKKAEDILIDATVLVLDEKKAKKAASFYRTNEANIGVVDYILVATTIDCDGELATLNSKHFKIFEDLKLFDFKKLDKV